MSAATPSSKVVKLFLTLKCVCIVFVVLESAQGGLWQKYCLSRMTLTSQ
jgi:hypothetical protein